MRPKSLMLLVLALGCGLVASIGISQVVKNRKPAEANTGATQRIFVAKRDIQFGQMLVVEGEDANLNLEDWPQERVPVGALVELDDVEGKRAKALIFGGQPVIEPMVIGIGDIDNGVSVKIPPGYRAITVKGTVSTAGGNLLLPKDRVDVMMYARSDPRNSVPSTGMRVILQDIEVFAVNQTAERMGTGSSSDEEAQAMTVKTVSLLVTPKQAAMLALAEEVGKLRLIMRGPGDEAEAHVESINIRELLGEESEKSDRETERGPSIGELARAETQNALDAAVARTPDVQLPKETEFKMEIWAGPTASLYAFREGHSLPVRLSEFGSDPGMTPAPAAAVGPAVTVPGLDGKSGQGLKDLDALKDLKDVPFDNSGDPFDFDGAGNGQTN